MAIVWYFSIKFSTSSKEIFHSIKSIFLHADKDSNLVPLKLFDEFQIKGSACRIVKKTVIRKVNFMITKLLKYAIIPDV